MKENLQLEDFPISEEIKKIYENKKGKKREIIEEIKNKVYYCIKTMVLKNKDNIFFTQNKRTLKMIQNNIKNKKCKYVKDKKRKGNINIQENEKETIVGELCKKLLDKKATAQNIFCFIRKYGEVKDRQNEFINFCKNLSKNIYIQKDVTSYNKKCDDNNNDDNDLDNINPNVNIEFENQKIEKQRELDEYKKYIHIYMKYILKELSKLKGKKFNCFICSYIIYKNIIDKNKSKPPTDMDAFFMKDGTIDKLIMLDENSKSLEQCKKNLIYIAEDYTLSFEEKYKKIVDLDSRLNKIDKNKKIEETEKKTKKKRLEENIEKRIEVLKNKLLECSEKELLFEKINKILLKKMFGNLQEEEKEIKIKRVLDPTSFWLEFENYFDNVKSKQYYDIKVPRPDRRKRQMVKVIDDIYKKLENPKYTYDSIEDKEILQEEKCNRIIELIKEAIPEKNIRNNKIDNNKGYKESIDNIENNKIERCDGYEEDIGHYVMDDNVLDDRKNDELMEHISTCEHCYRYYENLMQGNTIIREEIGRGKKFVLKPYKTISYEDELINYYIDKFKEEKNQYYKENLIFAYIKINQIDKAMKIYDMKIEEILKYIREN